VGTYPQPTLGWVIGIVKIRGKWVVEWKPCRAKRAFGATKRTKIVATYVYWAQDNQEDFCRWRSRWRAYSTPGIDHLAGFGAFSGEGVRE